MNVLFLANNPQVYLDFAIRLEENSIPFWAADNINDFHHTLSRVCIDVVLVDYTFMNFKEFDVYKHLKRNNSELIFLFMNPPDGAENLFVNWEDQVNDKYPQRWSKEIEDLLRIIANQPMIESYIYEPTKVTDLLEEIEKKAEINNKAYSSLSTKNISHRIENNLSPIKKNIQNNEEILTEGQQEIDLSSDVLSSNSSTKENVPFHEKSLLENFLQVKQTSNLTYTEYVLLDLFQRRKNEIVNTVDMAQLLNVPHNEKGKNKIYQCIYRIRLFIQEKEELNVSLVRVTKGCYSLIGTS